MVRFSAFTAFVLLLLTMFSCSKEEYVIDSDLIVPGLTPTLALPLVYADLGIAELQGPLGLDEFLDSQPNTQLAITFRERLFEIGLEDLVALPPQQAQESYAADAITAAIFNANLAGTELPIGQTYVTPFDFENGEELDSIRLGESFLSIDLLSTFRHDLDIQIDIPELSNADGPFSADFVLDYAGVVPVQSEVIVDVTGYLLDFTAPGNNNSLNIGADFIITHSGEMTSVGDSVSFDFELSSNSIKAAYGYMGQYSGIAEVDTQRVDVFEAIDVASIFFADPSIQMDFYNSSGIPMEINFSSLYAPSNMCTQIITGGALEDIPTIEPAASPGLTATTQHIIDDSNTSPPLSDLLSEGPVELIYSAEGVTNPEGYAYNFILDTSKIICDATIILPLYASVDGYRFSDTLDLALSESLGIGGGTLSIDDVTQAQIRVIANNGLPLELAMQVLFLDAAYQVRDSLYVTDTEEVILPAGIVETNLPTSNPNHGMVIAASHKVTDTYFSPERLTQILDGDIAHIIIRLVGSTSDAASGQLVRFFPEDRVEVQVSAKIETDIDLSE
jgi:hypothetical protein